MIVGQDIHPERKIYYWGAIILEALEKKQLKEQNINCFSVYETIKADYDISAEVFLLALDWLYILGAIDGDNGYLKKCS